VSIAAEVFALLRPWNAYHPCEALGTKSGVPAACPKRL
jgi:hypothetical protein